MTVIVTFPFTTALWAELLVFALRRVVRHVQTDLDAVKALSEHLVPLFGRKESDGGP